MFKKLMIFFILSLFCFPIIVSSEDKKFAEPDSLYDSKEKIESEKGDILFHAELVGEATCEGYTTKMRVYEFCYKGVKYFAISGGYMSVKYTTNFTKIPVIERCD